MHSGYELFKNDHSFLATLSVSKIEHFNRHINDVAGWKIPKL